MSIGLLGVSAYMIVCGLQFIVGRDVIGIIGYIMTSFMNAVCVLVLQWISVIGLIDSRRVKNLYRCTQE
jgi:hypothetical protein